jgi:hypothetical protein
MVIYENFICYNAIWQMDNQEKQLLIQRHMANGRFRTANALLPTDRYKVYRDIPYVYLPQRHMANGKWQMANG